MILYSNDCPRCKILKAKLDEKKLEYKVVSEMNSFAEKGFKSLPWLEVDGENLDFGYAIKYINKL